MKNTLAFLLPALALAACSNGGTSDASTDTGVVDSEIVTDVPGTDVATDTGVDAGTADTGTPTDTGTPADAATDTGTPTDAAVTYNNCTTFTDLSGTSGTPTITFGGTAGLTYSPPCVSIHAGQSITFNGSFVTHPLGAGAVTSGTVPGIDATAGTQPSPITATSTGTTATIAFPTAGTYPFYCMVHYALGMKGVIQVQ